MTRTDLGAEEPEVPFLALSPSLLARGAEGTEAEADWDSLSSLRLRWKTYRKAGGKA